MAKSHDSFPPEFTSLITILKGLPETEVLVCDFETEAEARNFRSDIYKYKHALLKAVLSPRTPEEDRIVYEANARIISLYTILEKQYNELFIVPTHGRHAGRNASTKALQLAAAAQAHIALNPHINEDTWFLFFRRTSQNAGPSSFRRAIESNPYARKILEDEARAIQDRLIAGLGPEGKFRNPLSTDTFIPSIPLSPQKVQDRQQKLMDELYPVRRPIPSNTEELKRTLQAHIQHEPQPLEPEDPDEEEPTA